MKNKKRRLSSLFPDPASDPKIKSALATFRDSFDNSKGNRVSRALVRFRDRIAVKLADWKANALTREIGRVSKATGLRREIVEEVYQETPREECQNRCVEMAQNRSKDRSLFYAKTKAEKFIESSREVSKAARAASSDLERVNAALAKASKISAFGSYARAANSAPEWCKALARETIFPLAQVVAVADEWNFDEEATRFALSYAEKGLPLPSRADVVEMAARDIETSLDAGNPLTPRAFARVVRSCPFFGEIEICPRLQPATARAALESSKEDHGNFLALPGSPRFTFSSPKK